MAEFKLTQTSSVIRTSDGSHYPNTDPEYLAWLALGNTPDPADPPPIRKSFIEETKVEDFRTTDGAQTSMWAALLSTMTLYTARFTIMAYDINTGFARVWTAKASAKRLGAGALLVGTPVIETSMPDPESAGWGIAADTIGSTFRVRVTGAAGVTISWSMFVEFIRVKHDGLA